MSTLRAFITALLLTSSIGPSWAGTSTITTKDASGVTKTFDVITDGSGNFNGTAVICDGTAAANCAAVKAASTAAVAADPALVTRIADGGDVSLGAKADAHSCSSASAIACLGQIDDDVKSTGTVKGAGTAGTADTGVITIQGIASMTKLLVTPDANSAINVAQVNGTTLLVNTGATGAGSPRVTTAIDQATNAGAALVKGGVGVVNGGSFYQHVAASQTGAVLQSSTGAIGDYLSHCVIYPATTAAGSVTVFDNTNAAGTNVIEFATGTLSNLAPITIPVGAVSTAGAWKVTTGASETVVCFGKFS